MRAKSPSWASHSVTLNSPHFPSSITLKLQIKEKQIGSNQIPGVFRSGLNVTADQDTQAAQMYLTPEAWVICHLHDY